MLSFEQWISIIGLLFGGGVLGVIVRAWVGRRLGLAKSQNEAARDTNSAWDAIVENLQGQITMQTKNFTDQLTALSNEVTALKTKQANLEERLNTKDRLILKAIAHIGKLETLLISFDGLIPPRPEGLE